MVVNFSGNYGSFKYTDASVPVLYNGGIYTPYQGLTVDQIITSGYDSNITISINISNQFDNQNFKDIRKYIYYLQNSAVMVFDDNKNKPLFNGFVKTVTQNNIINLILSCRSWTDILNQNITQKLVPTDNSKLNKPSGSYLGSNYFYDVLISSTAVNSYQSLKKFEVANNYNNGPIAITWSGSDVIQCKRYEGKVSGNIITLDEELPMYILDITNSINVYSLYDKTITTAALNGWLADFRGFPYAVFKSQKSEPIQITPIIAR